MRLNVSIVIEYGSVSVPSYFSGLEEYEITAQDQGMLGII